MSEYKPKLVVDARGAYCPGPLMELIKAVKTAKAGDIIVVYSSDSGSKVDIPRWVERNGHKMLGIYEREGYTEFVIEKTK